ncbi:MAG: helix-turn-helix transcriptional regulator [Lachnoclostridium sp.]|nr:helix-turn-helix transcriptional regulator [Lachnoclostridium sp.]
MEEGMAKRIKDLRQEKGLTLEQVADVVGVGKSTVRKWETGMIANMRRDKIADLAKALGTTPAYLMGWEEDDSKKELSQNEPVLTEGEEVLLDLFRRVPEDKQQLVLQMIRAALGSQ